MLVNVLIAVAVLVGVVLLIAAVSSDAFRIERKLLMQAPAEKVFALIEDFHQWSSWSPWESLDPNLKRTHSGAAKGVGAIYEWQGNDKVGTGRMEITELAPNQKVTIKLDFFKPWEAHNTAELTLAPSGTGHEVAWAMSGTRPFMMKVMSVFVSMDNLVGKDFEKGLANMKALAEK